ncbi:MAG: hypothetical protein ACYSSO_12205 [Planctomycetota bacterium]
MSKAKEQNNKRPNGEVGCCGIEKQKNCFTESYDFMRRNKKLANKHDLSMSKLDKTSARIKSLFNNRMVIDQMSKRERNKLNKMLRRGQPQRLDELTEAQRKAYDKAQLQDYREVKRKQKWQEIREFLQIGIDIERDDPNPELFRTAKELLDIVDRAETEPSSVSKYEQQKFCTGLDRYIALLKAELKVEQEQLDIEVETGLDDIDKHIILIYQGAEKQAKNNVGGKMKLPSSRKIAAALYRARITTKQYSHTATLKRIRKLREKELIGNPDDTMADEQKQ